MTAVAVCPYSPLRCTDRPQGWSCTAGSLENGMGRGAGMPSSWRGKRPTGCRSAPARASRTALRGARAPRQLLRCGDKCLAPCLLGRGPAYMATTTNLVAPISPLGIRKALVGKRRALWRQVSGAGAAARVKAAGSLSARRPRNRRRWRARLEGCMVESPHRSRARLPTTARRALQPPCLST